MSMKVPWIVMMQSFKHPAVLAISQSYLQRIAMSQVDVVSVARHQITES